MIQQSHNQERSQRRFPAIIKDIFLPPEHHPDDGLTYWRERILLAILSTGLVFALFTFIPLGIMVVRKGYLLLAILNFAAFCCALVVLLSRSIKYEIRASITLFLTFAVGFYVILHFGFLSGGPIWLFAFAVISAVLLGLKAAVTALIVNALTLLITGGLMAAGHFGSGILFFPSLNMAVLAGANFILLNAVVAISVAVLVRGLQSITRKEKAAAEGLIQEREQLLLAREKLKNEVEHRKETEEALRKNENRYRLLAENVKDVIWTMNLDWKTTYISPSIFNARGYTVKEAMAQPLEEALTSESFSILKQALREDSGREKSGDRSLFQSKTLELEYRCKDGSKIFNEVILSPIRDREGRTVGILGVGRDISERKKAEEEKKRLENQLQQVQKMEAIATLAGGIAHQFNNALSLITANLDLMELDHPHDEPLRKYSDSMRKAAQRMAQLTGQLLAYARGGKYRAGTISISDFLMDTISLIGHTLNPSVRIELDLPGDLPAIKADLTQMQMVLTAVLSNASEAIEGDGLIQITGRNESILREGEEYPGLKPGAYVKLTIADNGKGMDEISLKRIFEPFYTTKIEGRGLGMAAVYGIIMNHGGWVSVHSESGRGTTVRIILPSTEIAEQAQKSTGIESIKGSGTVLLIEDEEAVMEVSKAILERLGYTVIAAKTAKEAVTIAESFKDRIDLALLDIILPDMKATTLFPILKNARPDLRVIICSGYSLDGPAREVMDAGADDFIQKPFSMATLSAVLTKVLGNRAEYLVS